MRPFVCELNEMDSVNVVERNFEHIPGNKCWLVEEILSTWRLS